MRFKIKNDLDTIGIWIECEGWSILRIGTYRAFAISSQLYDYPLKTCYISHSKKIKFIHSTQTQTYAILFTSLVFL